VLNVGPDLEPFRHVWCDGDPVPMTSLERESPVRVRVPAARQRLLDALIVRFGLGRLSVFHTHPLLTKPVRSHVRAAG
jgi:lipoyl(octanoyl) transferase